MLPFEWNYRRIVVKTYPGAHCTCDYKPFSGEYAYQICNNHLKLSFRYKSSKRAWKEVAERLHKRPKMDGSCGFQLVGV